MQGFQGFFILVLASGVLSQSKEDSQAVRDVANSNNEFTTALYNTLRRHDNGNLLFSPFSLSSAMAMVKAGARGDTAAEIQRGMRYPADDKILFSGFRSLLSTLKSNENFTLETANRVYAQKDFTLNREYENVLSTYFGASAQQVDFGESDAAARSINGWVEQITRNKIKDLFSADSFDSLTRLVLVNAIYFKGLWANKFDPDNTRKAQFYVSPTENVTVDMMKTESDFPFVDLSDELDAKAVALPYKGDRLSMIILLPNKYDGLEELEKKLENYNLTSIPSQMRNRKISLSLPRFKLETEIDLTGILSEMGMKSMFEDSADFSGIPSSKVPLKLSKAVQKAYLEVNEEGSEAAAATGFQLTLKSAFWGTLMKFEHPFVAYIVDNQTNSVLFVTSVTNPTVTVTEPIAARSALTTNSNNNNNNDHHIYENIHSDNNNSNITSNNSSSLPSAAAYYYSSSISFIPMLIVSSFILLRNVLLAAL